MKRYKACGLLAGLMILINSCNNKQVVLELQAVKHLPQFPSASAIEYSNHRLYLFGDDAPYAVVLDTTFNQLDTIRFLPDTAYRMSKETKPDIESATLMPYQGTAAIVAFGSLSLANRNTAFAFTLSNPRNVRSFPITELGDGFQNIKEKNIEGAAFVAGRLILANRAHIGNKTNQLIALKLDTPQHSMVPPSTIWLGEGKNVIGISGLYYIASKDRLLFTASEEATASTHADGAIGNSYIGWIERFTTVMQQQTVTPDELIPLQTVDPSFYRQKIEGICATQANNDFITLILAADNDDGKSTLFKVKMYN